MIFTNAKILYKNKVVEGSLYIGNDGKIEKITTDKNINDAINLKGALIIPGFIDIQMNGAFGIDFTNTNSSELEKFLFEIPKYGITCLYPTIITSSQNNIINMLELFNKYISKTSLFKGIHLEGPYISKIKKGAHNIKEIRKANTSELDKIISKANGNLKIITLAPEEVDPQLTSYLVNKNIIVSGGHSIATYDDVEKHFKQGLNLLTHFFNGMPKLLTKNTNREWGNIVTYGFSKKDIKLSIIADGYHILPKMVNTLYKLKGPNNLLLISDAAPLAKKIGKMNFANLKIENKENKIITLENTDTLSGSAITMFECWKNIIKFTDCSLFEASLMTSFNQAKLLQIDKEYGSIEENKYADLVIIKNDQVFITIKHGKIIYQNKKLK